MGTMPEAPAYRLLIAIQKGWLTRAPQGDLEALQIPILHLLIASGIPKPLGKILHFHRVLLQRALPGKQQQK